MEKEKAKLIIENCITGNYEHITFWIEKKEYRLKPASSITAEVSAGEVQVEFAVWFSRSEKMTFDCTDRKELKLKLVYNRKSSHNSFQLLILLVLILLLAISGINLDFLLIFMIQAFLADVIFLNFLYFFKGAEFMRLI